MGDADETAGFEDPGGRAGARLSVRVVGDGMLATHTLPDRGAVIIGRSERAALRVDDASVSRQHAILHVGAELRVEDLGSHNGTSVRGRRLGAGEIARVAPGEVITVGAITLIIQGHPARAPGEPTARGRTAARRTSSVTGGGEVPSRPPEEVVVLDPAMRELFDVVRRVARSELTILLLGETGVGKEVLAEAVHYASDRASGRFARINCAALSATLLESELFGHERGAFTGADQAKLGLLEAASGGTVFLDEVGELPLVLQGKLLRVLEDRRVFRVGAVEARPIDVRFVAATNRDLADEVTRGTFRRDLFYRLDGFSLLIPPLRERPAEIIPLARMFLERAWRTGRRPGRPSFSGAALTALQAHSWPGNVRELRNAVERAAVLAGGDVVGPEHLGGLDARIDTPKATTPRPAPLPGGTATDEEPTDEGGLESSDDLRAELAAREKQKILRVLEEHGGNQTKAAKALGMARNTLAARLEAYGIPRPRKG